MFPPSLSVVPTCTHQVLPKWEQHKPSNGAGWRGVVPTFPPFPPLFSYIEREQPIMITLLPQQGHSPTEAPSGWPVCRPHAEGSGCATWTQSPESSGDWSSPQSPESSGDWPLSPIGRDFGQSNRYPQSAEMSADQHPTPQRHALADPPLGKGTPSPPPSSTGRRGRGLSPHTGGAGPWLLCYASLAHPARWGLGCR